MGGKLRESSLTSHRTRKKRVSKWLREIWLERRLPPSCWLRRTRQTHTKVFGAGTFTQTCTEVSAVC